MQTIIALLFCLLLGVMVKAQGWFALLWLPLGFVIGRFVTAQIALPILLGLPRAIHLVSSGEMRAAVYRRLLFPPVLWIVHLSVILFLVRFFYRWRLRAGFGNGWEWTRVKDIVRETLFSRVYRACKEWKGWTGRRGFFERMNLAREIMCLTIEHGWIVGRGPGGAPYGKVSGFQMLADCI